MQGFGPVVLMLLACLLTGCMDAGATVTSSQQDAIIVYNGSETGVDEAVAYQCDGDPVHLQVTFYMEASRIKVDAIDGTGLTAFSNEYGHATQGADNRQLSGASGDWTLRVARLDGTDPFDGQYTARLTCQ